MNLIEVLYSTNGNNALHSQSGSSYARGVRNQQSGTLGLTSKETFERQAIDIELIRGNRAE